MSLFLRRIKFYCLCMALPALLGCGTFQIPLPGVGNVPATLDLPGGDQQVSFVLFNGYVVLETLINNLGPFYFILDSGASASVISPTIADQLPQDFTGATSIFSNVDPNTVSTRFIRVENAAIGSIQFHNFQAAILPRISLRTATQAIDIDGILGLPVFRSATLTVDYPARVVRLRQTALPSSDNCLLLQAQRDSADLLVLSLDVAGRSVQAVIDTGNNDFLLLPSGFASLPFDGPTRNGIATTVTGTLSTTVGKLDGNVHIGCIDVTKPNLTIAGNVASLGSGLFQQFIITLDQDSNLIQFQQPPQ